MTKAARECNIVQTVMTRQVANLENELKVKLFERNHRDLSLTVAGERFLKDAKKIVKMICEKDFMLVSKNKGPV